MRRSDAILHWVHGPKILDVGCTGHSVELDSDRWVHGRLHREFDHVEGIDIDESNVALLREAGFEGTHLASAESFRLPGRFDTIVAGELIEHLSNPGSFLERCREHLAPGGQVVLTTPYAFSLLYALYAFYKYPRTCENPEHTCWFCPRTIEESARRAGLKIRHFDLFADYDLGSPSRPYRLFARFITLLGPLIPRRLRCTTMLFVLEADTERPGGSDHARARVQESS